MLYPVDVLLLPCSHILFEMFVLCIVPVLKLEDLALDYEQLEFSCTCLENQEDDVQRLWLAL